MPNTVELTNPDQLATLTGKSFAIAKLGGGKASLTPLTPAAGSQSVPAKILLQGVEIEGLQAAQAAVGQGGAAQAGTTGGQTLLAAKIPLVEIEGAGKTVGAGKSTTVISLQTQGILKAGTPGTIELLRGEAKIAPAAQTAPAKAPLQGNPVGATAGGVKAQTVAMTATPGDHGGAAAKNLAMGSTLAKGTGLGVGLTVWGPLLLAGVATAVVGVGVYNYLQRRNGQTN
ncbi:MAG: hypothetical protein H7833_17495 [Magnetococcus sp. DMHC-1]|nr:hypothetical protein [Magnetococcales bacterium]